MMERLEELRLDEIHIDDGFWNFYRSVVRDRMLPYQWEILNDRVPDAPKSHCVENFKIAAGLAEGEYYGQVFQDSDIAKWLEAVAYALAGAELPELEAAADQAVDLLRKAQQEDGYLDTYYTIKEPGNRWIYNDIIRRFWLPPGKNPDFPNGAWIDSSYQVYTSSWPPAIGTDPAKASTEP